MAATLENSFWVSRMMIPYANRLLNKPMPFEDHKFKPLNRPLVATLANSALIRSISISIPGYSHALARSPLLKRIDEINNSPLLKSALSAIKISKIMSITQDPVPLILRKP